MENKWEANIKRIAQSPVVARLSKQFSEQITDYEGRLKKVVKDLDLRSRDAREKGRKQIDKLTTQLRQTRTEVEKRVNSLLNEEAKRLNERAVEVVKYIKTIANGDKETSPVAAPRKAKANKATTGSTKKATKAKATSKKTHKATRV